MMKKNIFAKDTAKKINRRDFLFSIGSATAGIAGWIIIPEAINPLIGKKTKKDFCPGLVNDIILRETAGGGNILKQDEQSAFHVVCDVNEWGLKILKNLNGKHTIQEIAADLHRGYDPEKLGHTQASVASFLAILAQAGLLTEPFFVNLHAVEITG